MKPTSHEFERNITSQYVKEIGWCPMEGKLTPSNMNNK